MCRQITWGVTKSISKQAVEAVIKIADSHDLRFEHHDAKDVPDHRRSLASDISTSYPRSFLFGSTREHHCDCGTSLCNARKAKKADQQAEKLRNKGWSEARIAKWLAQKQEESSKKRSNDLSRWRAAISETLAVPGVNAFSLHVHLIDDVSFGNVVCVSAKQVDEQLLANLDFGSVYLFVND